MILGATSLMRLTMKLYEEDFKKVPYFKNEESFFQLNEKYEKYRKSMITLALFSLIINSAGVTIDKSGIGIIGGTISRPSLITVSIFLSLLYATILYVSNIYYQLEHFHILKTGKKQLLDFKSSSFNHLVQEKLNSKLFHHLHKLGFDIKKIYGGHFSENKDNLFHLTFEIKSDEIMNVDKQQKLKKEIKDLLSEEFTSVEHLERAEEYFNSIYKIKFTLICDEMKKGTSYFNRHFRRLKLLHIKNFFEIRLPIYVAIIALFSFLFNDFFLNYHQAISQPLSIISWIFFSLLVFYILIEKLISLYK
jgi:hypothetical protein